MNAKSETKNTEAAMEITPRLIITSDIGEACADEASRYSIDSVRYVPKSEHETFMLATNGRILAVTCVHSDGITEPGYVDADLTKSTTKIRRSYDDDGEHFETSRYRAETELVMLHSEWRDPARKLYDGEHAGIGAFPPVCDVLPELDDSYVQVGIDAHLLHKLGKALQSANADKPSLTLFVKAGGSRRISDKPVIAVGSAGIGVIMPLRDAEGDPDKRYMNTRAALKAVCK